MKILTFLRGAAVAIVPAFVLAPTAGFAAHAGAPYTNVDHSNDMGNDTGDSQVESLNSTQLNENYHGPVQLRAPTGEPSTSMAPQSGEPPPVMPQTAPH